MMTCSQVLVLFYAAIVTLPELVSSEGNNGFQLPFNLPALPALPQLPNLFPAAPCVGPTDQREGFCRNPTECSAVGGVPDGPCALNLGVCCLNVMTCGASSLVNNTYFVNKGAPNGTTSPLDCGLTVTKLFNVVQIKLELMVFDIAGVDEEGKCSTDALWVEGLNSGYTSPRICGNATGQHLFLPVDQASGTQFTVKVGMSGSSKSRRWLIKVIQLERGNPSAAPENCLEYYTSQIGSITSFNYQEDGLSSGNIAGLRYAICFRREQGYCSIQFQPVNSAVNRTRRSAVGGYYRLDGHYNSYRPLTRRPYLHAVVPMRVGQYRPPYQSPFGDDWGMYRYTVKPFPGGYVAPMAPEGLSNSTVTAYEPPIVGSTGSTVIAIGSTDRPIVSILPLEPEGPGGNNSTSNSTVPSNNSSNAVGPVADNLTPESETNACSGQDTLGFPSASATVCEATGDKTVTATIAPFIVYVDNRGPKRGKGFHYKFNHVLC